MLKSLTIENYGLIPKAEIAFADGATVFSGETGSGKTMLLGALGLALGERASVDAVRRGAARASVTLVLEPDAALRARLEEDGFPVDAGEDAVIVRDVSDAGKSGVRINGRPATAGYLRDLAGTIVDMIGQHDAQRLLAPAYHGDLLDRFGAPATIDARDAVAADHAALAALRARLDALAGDERRAAFLLHLGEATSVVEMRVAVHDQPDVGDLEAELAHAVLDQASRLRHRRVDQDQPLRGLDDVDRDPLGTDIVDIIDHPERLDRRGPVFHHLRQKVFDGLRLRGGRERGERKQNGGDGAHQILPGLVSCANNRA